MIIMKVMIIIWQIGCSGWPAGSPRSGRLPRGCRRRTSSGAPFGGARTMVAQTVVHRPTEGVR